MKNRNMIKKGLACVMAATMTIGLAACGGSNGGGDDVSKADFSDPESIKGTITVAVLWYNKRNGGDILWQDQKSTKSNLRMMN